LLGAGAEGKNVNACSVILAHNRQRKMPVQF